MSTTWEDVVDLLHLLVTLVGFAIFIASIPVVTLWFCICKLGWL